MTDVRFDVQTIPRWRVNRYLDDGWTINYYPHDPSSIFERFKAFVLDLIVVLAVRKRPQ